MHPSGITLHTLRHRKSIIFRTRSPYPLDHVWICPNSSKMNHLDPFFFSSLLGWLLKRVIFLLLGVERKCSTCMVANSRNAKSGVNISWILFSCFDSIMPLHVSRVDDTMYHCWNKFELLIQLYRATGL